MDWIPVRPSSYAKTSKQLQEVSDVADKRYFVSSSVQKCRI